MKRLFSSLAQAGYFLAYPIIGLVLHNSHRVRAIVVYKDKVLLQRSYIGGQRWSLPGGGVEQQETPEIAAAREVQEETNVKLSADKFKAIGAKRLPQHSWPQMNITFLEARLHRWQTPQVTHHFEIIETSWFPLDQLPGDRSKTVDIGLALYNKNKINNK